MGVSASFSSSEPLPPRLFTALMGDKGDGKSRTITRARALIQSDHEYLRVANINSDRALDRLFPGDDRGPNFYVPAWVVIQDELRILLEKMCIQGSTLASSLCTLFYDGPDRQCRQIRNPLRCCPALDARRPQGEGPRRVPGDLAGLYRAWPLRSVRPLSGTEGLAVGSALETAGGQQGRLREARHPDRCPPRSWWSLNLSDAWTTGPGRERAAAVWPRLASALPSFRLP